MGNATDAERVAIERLMMKIAELNDDIHVCIVCGSDAPFHDEECEFVAVTEAAE